MDGGSTSTMFPRESCAKGNSSDSALSARFASQYATTSIKYDPLSCTMPPSGRTPRLTMVLRRHEMSSSS
eukprot:3927796-Prymnesium_polylepis.1